MPVKPALLSTGWKGLSTPSPSQVVAENNPLPGIRPEFTGDVQKGSLIDYVRVLSRRKGLLIVLAMLGSLAGVVFTLTQSPLYRARTSIEIQDLNQEFLNMKTVSPVEDSSSVNALTDMQTQIQILQSESLIERTLARLSIASLSTLNPETVPIARWRNRDASTPGNTKLPSQTRLIDAAAKNLKVSVTGQTRIIEVSFQSTDPKIASGFANTLAAEFIEQNMQARWQMSQGTSAWLGRQLDDLRNKLRHSDDALQAYAREKGLIYTADKENVSTGKLRQLQAEMSRAQADRVVKESRFNIASTAAADTLPDVLSDNNLQTLRANLSGLRRQEAELSTIFKPDYSRLKRVRAEIASMEAGLEHQRAAIVSRISNDYKEAEHREGLLSAEYGSQVRLVMQDSQNSIQYDILKREVDTNRQIYDATLQRVKESSIASALRASNIRIVDPARTPEKPYKPNLPLNSAAGMMCGLMIGLVVAVTHERAHQSLHQPGDAGRLLGLPELGVIPRAGRDATGIADSFRSVLASIIFSRDHDGQSVLVITSAGPNEGKTTAAINLSVALSRIGLKVLLIDGDIRKPCIHDVFNVDNGLGVTSLLDQKLRDGSAADAAIRETEFPNLSVLPSGPALATGWSLLFSASMPSLLAHYRKDFDMIIIDTPPVLHMPDARVLGRMADSVVLVARAGRTLREAALSACERLVQDRTPVLGVILNDWNAKSSPGGYYGNYKSSVMKRYTVST